MNALILGMAVGNLALSFIFGWSGEIELEIAYLLRAIFWAIIWNGLNRKNKE